MARFSLLFLTWVFLSSCSNDGFFQKESSDNVEAFVFGQYYGYCTGEACIEIFKLENETLFEDTTDRYPAGNTPYEGTFVPVKNENHLRLESLCDLAVRTLQPENQGVIGMPDAGDWGGFYLQFNVDGETKFWLLDTMKPNVDNRFHPLMDSLQAVISTLK